MTLHHTWISADNTDRDARIKQLWEEGRTYRQIAKEAGVGHGTLQNTLRRLREDGEIGYRNRELNKEYRRGQFKWGRPAREENEVTTR